MLFFHQQGTILRHWAQAGATETSFTLGEIMSPLESFRDRCLFLFGIDNKIASLNRSNGHNSSARTALTAELYSTSVDQNGNYIPEANQPDVQGHANGPSVCRCRRSGRPSLAWAA